MRKSGRDVAKMDASQPSGPVHRRRQVLGTLAVWQTIKLFSGNYTAGYLLNAVDMQLTPQGHRAEGAGGPHLCEAVPADHGDEPQPSPSLLPARLSDRLPALGPADAQLEPGLD